MWYLPDLSHSDFCLIKETMREGLDVWQEALCESSVDKGAICCGYVSKRMLEFRSGYTFRNAAEAGGRDPTTHMEPCVKYLGKDPCLLERFSLKNWFKELRKDASVQEQEEHRKQEVDEILRLAARDAKRDDVIRRLARMPVPGRQNDRPVFLRRPVPLPLVESCSVGKQGELFLLLMMLRDNIIHRFGAFHMLPEENVAVLRPRDWHVTPVLDNMGLGVPLDTVGPCSPSPALPERDSVHL